MRILAIETSCDETAVAIVEGTQTEGGVSFKVLGNALLSQIEVHREYGGVYPALAKREHAKNLLPLLSSALEETELLHEDAQVIPDAVQAKLSEWLAREGDLATELHDFLAETEAPGIDAIAVTAGPGLEPALWVGVNFARSLALAWDKPLLAINHVEGHIVSALATQREADLFIAPPQFPLLGLGVAGGHTDLVLMSSWHHYETLGATLDDSVGEAFDKVARMMGLPYPGGPEISRLAEIARERGGPNPHTLPRPMLHSGDYSFSFSGLKTAVLYLIKKLPELTETDKELISLEFEDAVAEVLWKKTSAALTDTGAKTVVISGGVSANKHIRRTFEEKLREAYPEVHFAVPPLELATDNAIMIAFAGYYRALNEEFVGLEDLRADGNLSLSGGLK